MTGHDDLLPALGQHDTPTVWNALAKLRGRSTEGLTRGPPVVTDPGMRPIVGRAVTARMVSSDPADLTATQKDAIRFGYYRMVHAALTPRIVVMQDVGSRPGAGSIWGEVNAAIHRGLGVVGVITDGAVRDLDALDGFPILAGHVCLGNGLTQITEIGVPVEVLGLHVRPGDVIHADRHGAMVVPEEHLAALPAAIEALLEREREIIRRTRLPGFDAEALIAAWHAFEGGPR